MYSTMKHEKKTRHNDNLKHAESIQRVEKKKKLRIQYKPETISKHNNHKYLLHKDKTDLTKKI